MTTLDDKILGEKTHYYCSSSEDEDDSKESDDDSEDRKESFDQAPQYIQETELRSFDGVSTNTGPKGVIKDWQRFKQLESERREEQEREKLELIKKLSLTCQSQLDEEKQKEEDEQLDKELQELLGDKILDEFIQRRMQEMMSNADQCPRFGSLKLLKSGQEFLDVVDRDSSLVTTVIHIYEEGRKGCQTMNLCLQNLAKEYVNVQFCSLEAASAGMSWHFKRSGVPALLVYKNGNLIGNFVRLTDEFGDFFVASDVENFLLEHGMLPDQSLIPTVIRQKDESKDESDSD